MFIFLKHFFWHLCWSWNAQTCSNTLKPQARHQATFPISADTVRTWGSQVFSSWAGQAWHHLGTQGQRSPIPSIAPKRWGMVRRGTRSKEWQEEKPKLPNQHNPIWCLTRSLKSHCKQMHIINRQADHPTVHHRLRCTCVTEANARTSL